MPRDCRRRPCAQVRWRHRHQARLSPIWHRRQFARSDASTTKVRMSGPSDTRSGGSSSRVSPGRLRIRSSMPRVRTRSCLPSSPRSSRTRSQSWLGARSATCRSRSDRRSLQLRRSPRHAQPGRARRLPHRGAQPEQDDIGLSDSIPHPTGRIRFVRASRSPISVSKWMNERAC